MTIALSIKNLHKTYGDFQALKGINLEVEKGDFFALLGPNGAGKSTTIGIITSLVNRSDGAITVFDHDLFDDPGTAKSFMGVVPQEINLNIFETCEQIILNQATYYGIPYRVSKPRAQFLLEKLDLWHKRDTIARDLSGGMKRRLMIARALIHSPKILILDEPTAGVDVEIRHSMWQFLQELNRQGTTIILTTHYLEEAESLCNKVAIIDHGNIVTNTSMAELLQQLECETMVMYLANPNDTPVQLANFETRQINPTTIEIDIKQEQPVSDAICALAEQGIKVHSMRNKANRLEQLFINLIQTHSGETTA